MPTLTPVPDSELANAVRALAMDAVEAARSGHPIVDHRTYVFVGDGCLMEGLSHEASSLAGTLGDKEVAGASAVSSTRAAGGTSAGNAGSSCV